MFKNLFYLIFFSLNVIHYSQTNDLEAAAYNVGFGVVNSTIGAIINKKPHEPIGKVIKKSIWQGALGGAVDFGSKVILREAQEQNKWEYIWMAKIVNSAGTSIKENASLNKDFWETWHINIGFNRIEFNTKDRFSVRYKLMPVAFYYTMGAFINDKFEVNNSLKTGEFIFSTPEIPPRSNIDPQALSYPGFILMEERQLKYITLTIHEIVHQYQRNDFSIFNTYLYKPLNNWGQHNNTVNWMNKHLYVEWYYLIYRPLYNYERSTSNNYYDNFFEHEAAYYSNQISD